MRCRKIKNGIDRNDAVGVNHVVAIMVVAYDMVEMHRVINIGDLVQFARICPDVGVIDNPLAVAFKMQVIDQIKTNQRRKKPPISLCQF